MGNFIENTFSGIGNAVSGLFRGSGSSRGVGQQVAEAARQKAMEDRHNDLAQGNLTEAEMDDLRAKTMRDPRSMPGTSGGVPMKKGGKVKAYANGGSVSSRGDGIAQRGKTKGRIV
jgi:hypothetical protein